VSDKTGIEWTDATWNPLVGCTKVSAGCDHCYAETLVSRFAGKNKGFPNPFDVVTIRPDRFLEQPLRWPAPRRIFVNSLADLFHADVPDDFIARVFAVMAMAPQHTFQLLTKRQARMRALLRSPEFEAAAAQASHAYRKNGPSDWAAHWTWPLPNVWLGVSVENQQWADIRIPALLDTPAAVRFISAEPLLDRVDLARYLPSSYMAPDQCSLDWVIAGGESGPEARPMHPAWPRLLRDQCHDTGVAFLFKQWGEWAPLKQLPYDVSPKTHTRRSTIEGKDTFRVGKRKSGRELDGLTWDGYPA
jgi:protein gp37